MGGLSATRSAAHRHSRHHRCFVYLPLRSVQKALPTPAVSSGSCEGVTAFEADLREVRQDDVALQVRRAVSQVGTALDQLHERAFAAAVAGNLDRVRNLTRARATLERSQHVGRANDVPTGADCDDVLVFDVMHPWECDAAKRLQSSTVAIPPLEWADVRPPAAHARRLMPMRVSASYSPTMISH